VCEETPILYADDRVDKVRRQLVQRFVGSFKGSLADERLPIGHLKKDNPLRATFQDVREWKIAQCPDKRSGRDEY
jgi:hypothetical protein